jgi:hypothetical protein
LDLDERHVNGDDNYNDNGNYEYDDDDGGGGSKQH